MAWVSLDAWDNTPARFWAAVLAALDKGTPGLSQDALALLQASQEPPLEAVLTALINTLSEAVTRRVLLLDEYQLISEPAIHRQLAFLLEHLPPHLHVMLSSRLDPPLPLARLRAGGQLLEVRTDQLRCTAQEAAAFLTTAMGIELADSVLRTATARTEGWLVGLQLLGLSLHGHAGPSTVLEELSGSQRYILDYLTEEVLRQQPAALQRFLLHTSILSQLCASLCDAVVGQPGSQEVLEGLERANLFLVPLDGQRHWYRYHALFAEALRFLLEQRDEEEVRVLHLRASLWYAEQGDPTQAVPHAIQARDWLHAADLIEHVVGTLTWGKGEYGLARRWLEQLPAEVLRARPRLCLAYAKTLSPLASPETVEAWLQVAKAGVSGSLFAQQPERLGSEPRVPSDQEELLGEILALRASQASYRGESQAALALAQQALSHLSEQNLSKRAEVVATEHLAYFFSGGVVPATHSALEAARLGQAAGNVFQATTYLANAAWCFLIQGDLHEAWHRLEQVIERGRGGRSLLLPAVSMAYVLQAEVLREWNQLEKAWELAQKAVQLNEQEQRLYHLEVCYLTLAQIALAQGQREGASVALERATQIMEQVKQPNADLRALYTTAPQVQLWLAGGELEQAIRWAQGVRHEKPGLSPLAREREEVAVARVLLAQNQPGPTLTSLASLLEQATRQQRWGHVLEYRLLQALAYQRLDQQHEALAALLEGIRLAELQGYIRRFVDEGTQLVPLLLQLRKQERQRGRTPYLDTLVAAFAHEARTPGVPPPRKGPFVLSQPLLDPLSERELEVLHLVARGASNQDTAAALVVTVETVKRHVSNLFSKLGVHKRTQAVAQARALGLLSDEP